MNQKKAKVLIKDYLRESGRKGVTSLMRDLAKFSGGTICSKRTLEKWLKEQNRQLNDHNWEPVRNFIESDKFKSLVDYANEGSAEDRLKQVAEGFIALYGKIEHPDGMYILPSRIHEQGILAVNELNGNWKNISNQADQDVPRSICKMEPIPGTRYAKFAYIQLSRKRQISATGLVIYLYSEEAEEYDYLHMFVLQLWRRRDPETGSNMPGILTYSTSEKDQPRFSISSVLNRYFYKDTDSIVSRGGANSKPKTRPATETIELRGGLSINRKTHRAYKGKAVYLKKNRHPIAEEEKVIDLLLEDVLPHGYA